MRCLVAALALAILLAACADRDGAGDGRDGGDDGGPGRGADATDGDGGGDGSGEGTTPAGLQLVAAEFDSPLYVTEADDGSSRLFVVEQAGRVQVVAADGSRRADPFVDLTDRVGSDASEQGLLGMAFHPAFAANGVVVLSYTDQAGDTVLSRFRMLGDGSAIDPRSEEVLLQVDQPFDNHNGGHILYGPDGYLYFGLGDGGLAADPNSNGQRKETLLGDLLRLDVGPSGPYRIPADNPYAGSSCSDGAAGPCPEIWASGLRNPWRFHFDPLNGDLWIADVGQNFYEEVDHQPAGEGGRNYGWNLYEGNHHFPSLADVTVPIPGMTFPVAEYDHDAGCSVTGGPVYRGTSQPGLVGAYLYGDFCSGTVWRLDGPTAQPKVFLETGLPISSFGQDLKGEVYLLDHSGGRLFRLA